MICWAEDHESRRGLLEYSCFTSIRAHGSGGDVRAKMIAVGTITPLLVCFYGGLCRRGLPSAKGVSFFGLSFLSFFFLFFFFLCLGLRGGGDGGERRSDGGGEVFEGSIASRRLYY